jgi:hypothetical protein
MNAILSAMRSRLRAKQADGTDVKPYRRSSSALRRSACAFIASNTGSRKHRRAAEVVSGQMPLCTSAANDLPIRFEVLLSTFGLLMMTCSTAESTARALTLSCKQMPLACESVACMLHVGHALQSRGYGRDGLGQSRWSEGTSTHPPRHHPGCSLPFPAQHVHTTVVP